MALQPRIFTEYFEHVEHFRVAFRERQIAQEEIQVHLDQVGGMERRFRRELRGEVGTECPVGPLEPDLVVNAGSDNGPHLEKSPDIVAIWGLGELEEQLNGVVGELAFQHLLYTLERTPDGLTISTREQEMLVRLVRAAENTSWFGVAKLE